ncbi:MAG: TauD/TfdA family dioxygenase [Actinomycetota bacterium]
MADSLTIAPTAGSLGATVDGLEPGSVDAHADQLRVALDTHLVLFVPGLSPSVQHLRDLGQLFGELEVHPYLSKVDDSVDEVVLLDSEDSPKADLWHTDVTFSPEPPHMAILHMVECPPFGGDTMWLNTYDVFDSLSAPMQAMLETLTCLHKSAQGDIKAEHPVVRVHPETGRKGLFVNKQFSRRIPQLSHPESQALLRFLFKWQEQVKFSCRWTWSPGDVVLWDERFTLHSVVDDTKERRILHRVTALGDGPIAAADTATWSHHEPNAMASSGYFGIGGYEF